MHISRHSITSIICCLRGLLVLCVFVAAAGLPASDPSRAQEGERVTVRVDGRAVFRVGEASDADADSRRRRIEQRIATLLENPQALTAARVEPTTDPRGERVITIAAVPVVYVSRSDAEDNLATVDQVATQWAASLTAATQEAAVRRQSSAGRFKSDVQAAIEAAFGRLVESIVSVIPKVLAAALVLAVFWLLACLLRWLLKIVFHRLYRDPTTENLAKQIGYYSVWLIGLLVAADAMGFDPQTVVTGLGLTSLVLGFALKDILSNFVSGLLILTSRSFKLGDQIIVGETEGNVERIELRATQIRTYDGRAVLVPNGELLTSRIVNNTASAVRRGSVLLLVPYDSDLYRVRATMLKATAATEGVLSTPEPSVRLRELGAEGIAVESRFWTDSRRSDFLATQSAVSESILNAFQREQLPLPSPSELKLILPRRDQDNLQGDGVLPTAES